MAAITFWANFDGGTLSSLHNKAGKSVKSGKTERENEQEEQEWQEWQEEQDQNQAVVADKNDECQKENRKDNIFSAQLNFWPLKM